ncbi:ornithine cyclodeaminase 1 [Streptomyces tanashiensis]|uniref:ornithine cyclodeaminase family protein n=1 Tax=Streptomyces tanashiensis TaxID=67367 RepID=UPI001672389E|nr:ornithine cyclodeaminase family protein [Streptomyces tanashiensis]GGS76685.1 ornithine cyclodeaminase 1 [Streptomyces tanashiensis]
MSAATRQTVQAIPAYVGPDTIRALVGYEDVVEEVAAALADFSRGLGDSPVAVFAPAGRDGDVHVKSAWLPGRSVFTVKVATWFAERARRGGTPGAGAVAVFDARTGDLQAVLEDEHHLSDIRTAAAGALAARTLARPDSAVVGVLGTGVQAYLQILAAADELPIREARVWGRRDERVRRLAAALVTRRPDLRVTPVGTARQACEGADVLVTATASTEPLVDAEWLAPGLHITAVGADDPTKAELSPSCLYRADRIVVDSRALTAVHGDLARAQAAFPEPAELGEVLAGSAPGRERADEITVCKLIGLGVQDLAAAQVTLDLLRGTGPQRSRPPACATDLPLSNAPRQGGQRRHPAVGCHDPDAA